MPSTCIRNIATFLQRGSILHRTLCVLSSRLQLHLALAETRTEEALRFVTLLGYGKEANGDLDELEDEEEKAADR